MPPSSLDDSITFTQCVAPPIHSSYDRTSSFRGHNVDVVSIWSSCRWLKLNASSHILIKPYSLTRPAMITMILRGVIVATSLDRRMGRTTKKPLKCFPSNAKPNHRVVDNRCSDVLVLARGSNGRLNNCLAVELHTQKGAVQHRIQEGSIRERPQITPNFFRFDTWTL